MHKPAKAQRQEPAPSNQKRPEQADREWQAAIQRMEDDGCPNFPPAQ